MAEMKLQTPMKFILLLGVVSLFADMTYEAARSVTGPYLAILGASGTVVGFAGQPLTNEQLWSLNVDLLVPAAVGNVITSENADAIRARAIVEGANMPTTVEAMDVLADRGVLVVPDILANAGGVVASMEEYSRSLSAMKVTREEVFATITQSLGTAFDNCRERSRATGANLTEVAVALAVERVYGAMRRRRMT